jgi:hypothetical protein
MTVINFVSWLVREGKYLSERVKALCLCLMRVLLTPALMTLHLAFPTPNVPTLSEHMAQHPLAFTLAVHSSLRVG